MSQAPWPLELRVRRAAGVLDVSFDDGVAASLPAALLRRMTPSAADRGHGGDRDKPLEHDFSGVGLTDACAVGAYAVRLVFSDGHDSGLYTWALLHQLAVQSSAGPPRPGSFSP